LVSGVKRCVDRTGWTWKNTDNKTAVQILGYTGQKLGLVKFEIVEFKETDKRELMKLKIAVD
jgi:hypothetical protein